MVSCFPVSRIPPLSHGATFTSLALSILAFSAPPDQAQDYSKPWCRTISQKQVYKRGCAERVRQPAIHDKDEVHKSRSRNVNWLLSSLRYWDHMMRSVSEQPVSTVAGGSSQAKKVSRWKELSRQDLSTIRCYNRIIPKVSLEERWSGHVPNRADQFNKLVCKVTYITYIIRPENCVRIVACIRDWVLAEDVKKLEVRQLPV